MSGSVTTMRVAPTAAELERQARARARRERERQIQEAFHRAASRVSQVTVVAAATREDRVQAEARTQRSAAQRAQASTRGAERETDAGRGREMTSQRVELSRAAPPPERVEVPRTAPAALPSEPLDAPRVAPAPTRPQPPAPAPGGGPAPTLPELARALADEARREGFAGLAADAEAARDAAELAEVERALDDEIDAAAIAALVESRVEAAAHAVLGTAWTPQPDTVGRRRVSAVGDTLRSHVRVDDDGTAVVELVVDARAPEINGLPSTTCSQENRITNAILGRVTSAELEVVEAPAVTRRAATRLGGLVSTTSKDSSAKSRARAARRA